MKSGQHEKHGDLRPSILMIAYTYFETDPRVMRAAEAGAEAGFRVDMLALRRPGQPAFEETHGVRVFRVPQERYRGRSRLGYVHAYGEFFLRAAIAAARMSAPRNFAVVHVHNMPDVLVFAALVPRLRGAKVILDIHDPMPETFGAKYSGPSGKLIYRILLALEKLSVAFAQRTLTVNEPVRDVVLAKHGYKPEAIDVIANFADDRLFQVMPYPPITDRVRFVFHGTILERYGLRTLVEAVAKMQHRDRISIRLIGEGDFSQRLKELIAAHDVQDTIEFVNRAFPLREIPRLLADCHAGLVPLDLTPIADVALPLKLIEYSCLGLPSIAARTTAISHYFSERECMFYPPGEPDALAALLDGVAADPSVLDAYRAQLPAVRRRLSWAAEKERYIAILFSLAGLSAPMPELSGSAGQRMSTEELAPRPSNAANVRTLFPDCGNQPGIERSIPSPSVKMKP